MFTDVGDVFRRSGKDLLSLPPEVGGAYGLRSRLPEAGGRRRL